MKIVLGIFFVVNLLVFFWIYQSEDQIDSLAAERATNMPLLRLLSEKESKPIQSEPAKVATAEQPKVELIKEKPKTELIEEKPPQVLNARSEEAVKKQIEAEEAAVVKKPQPKAVFIEAACYSLGPFVQDKLVNSTFQKLQKRGLSIKKRYETRRELSGFWVYIPPLPSRADAQKVVSMLKKRGVKDFLIVPTGVKKHAISLGFFRTREGAEQHKTHMQTLGLAPVMDDSYKERSGFWLDFSSSDTPALPNELVNALQSHNEVISIKKRQCLK